MELLLGRGPALSLRPQPSGGLGLLLPFDRSRSTCSADLTTDTSSSSCDADESEADQQSNARRITLCKQVLMEATTNFATTPVRETALLKNVNCRNSGALLPLLSMLAAESEAVRTVRALETLSFMLLDRANRRACLELHALDILLDILRRSTDQQVLLSGLEALCNLCKHDAKDKMTLWNHPNKGALLCMLSNRHNAIIIVETLRACRTLCFAAGTPCCSTATSSSSAASSSSSTSSSNCASSCCGSASDSLGSRDHHDHRLAHHTTPASLQLLEPALLTVASELLHPSADTHVLSKALKLLRDSSAIVACASGARCPQGCWHNVVFRIVPLLTHCADVEVVESALTVLVNLSEHSFSHNMLFASGCIPPLLHLLSHKRCAVSQQSSCVLSALAEGGLSRDKLCQDTALLAMLRVLNANHCVTVTLGVLYMLERLASYRNQVVRSLKGWGAVQLLQRLMGTTQDKDAAAGCRQLLRALGLQALPIPSAVVVMATQKQEASGNAVGAQAAAHLYLAHSSIGLGGGMAAAAGVSGNPPLCRTISAAAAFADAVMAADVKSPRTAALPSMVPMPSPFFNTSSAAVVERPRTFARPNHHSSFRFHGSNGVACGLAGPIAAAVASTAAY